MSVLKKSLTTLLSSLRSPVQWEPLQQAASIFTADRVASNSFEDVKARINEDVPTDPGPLAKPAQTRIYMCPPSFFNVEHYLLNDHMTMSIPVDYYIAQNQWWMYYFKLSDILPDLDIKFFQPQGGLVDKVFCANAGILLNNKALVANFSAGPRKAESMYYLEYFNKHGFTTDLTKHRLEGAGDGLFSHGKKKLWLGSGFRSDLEVRDEVVEFFEMEDVYSLKLLLGKWYHLDTCFLPLGENEDKLLYYPEAFAPESLSLMREQFGEENMIPCDKKDASYFVCNGVFLHNNIFVHKISAELKGRLEELGYTVHQSFYDQFLLGGGSLKCSILHHNIRKD